MQGTCSNKTTGGFYQVSSEDRTRFNIRDTFERINPFLLNFVFIELDHNKTVTDDIMVSWCYSNCEGDYEYAYGSVPTLDEHTINDYFQTQVFIDSIECLIFAFEIESDLVAFLLTFSSDFNYLVIKET